MASIDPTTPTATPEDPEGLRRWARGLYPLEAATELLIRAFDGWFARSGLPWIGYADDTDEEDAVRYWLDADQFTPATTGALSRGERPLLAVVASLAGGRRVDLEDALPGMDRDHVRLVLAAIAHAAGSHEHTDLVTDPDTGTGTAHGVRLPGLYSWPEEEPPPATPRDRTQGGEV